MAAQLIQQAVQELQEEIDAHDTVVAGLVGATAETVAALQQTAESERYFNARYSTTASGAIWEHPRAPQ
jgi:hypothetical protein